MVEVVEVSAGGLRAALGKKDLTWLLAAQRAALAAKRRKVGLEGGIIPGSWFVTTGQALTAMNTAKAYIDDLDKQIHLKLCTPIKDAQGNVVLMQGEPIGYNCPKGDSGFLSAWNSYANEFYDWYLDNESFGDRWVDTNAIFDRAQVYIKRTTDWRKKVADYGIKVEGPIVAPEERNTPIDWGKDLVKYLLWAGAMVGGGLLLYKFASSKIVSRPMGFLDAPEDELCLNVERRAREVRREINTIFEKDPSEEQLTVAGKAIRAARDARELAVEGDCQGSASKLAKARSLLIDARRLRW